MAPLIYQFSLLSATFAHGAYQTQNFNRPELRAPSVKGMIRWWHEALGFPAADARILFGQVSDRRAGIDGNLASRVNIRISPMAVVATGRTDFMPHKGSRGGSKAALLPNTCYQLVLSGRRESLPPHLWNQLRQATEAWLLLGAIGQRGNRAAGSVLWDEAPTSSKDFELAASQLLADSRLSFAVLAEEFDGREADARRVAGDFLAADAFNGLAPFGAVRPERKPSPLKLKCVRLDGSLRLLAVWDGRKDSRDGLRRGVRTLVNARKPIGELLEQVLPQLAP
jgi:hypothetical protein